MIYLLSLFEVLPVESKNEKTGGIIVLAIIWDKIRPVIIIQSVNSKKIYLGISHSKKRKNMMPLTPEGIMGLTIDKNTCFGLANKPATIIKEIGFISIDKAQELIDAIRQKKIYKIEKRNKSKQDNITNKKSDHK